MLPTNEASEMNNAYGKVMRSISVSMSWCAPVYLDAITKASCGASRSTTAVTTSSAAARVPVTRSISSLTASGPCFSLYSARTGTKAIENEPSADSRRMKLGILNAMKKMSIAAVAPNTAA